MSSSVWTQVGELGRRSVMRTLRQPAQVVPTITFPLFLLAINAGGLEATTSLPGFPTSSYPVSYTHLTLPTICSV